MPAAPILVLSALAENRERLCAWLALPDRECVPLADADALWARLRQDKLTPPALLVLDGHPAEDSYPLINRLQGDPAGARLPVLLLTENLADSSRRFYAGLLHGLECLAKPVAEAALRARAAACLAQDDARRAIESCISSADWDQTLREGLLALDAGGNIRYANRQAALWLKLSPLALCELNLLSLLQTPVTGLDAAWSSSAPATALAGQAVLEMRHLPLWRADGGTLLTDAALAPLAGSPYPLLFAFRRADADAVQAQAQGLEQLVRVDMLTGLPARAHLDEAMLSLLREGQKPVLMLLDIDHLRHVNETLGYGFGDHLLQAVAARLRGARESGLLASMGGGRFAFLVDDAADYRVAGRIAQRLQAQFRLPFLLAGHEVFCSISVGIALYPASGDDAEQLLQGAERALVRAKMVGRNVIQFDSAELNRFSIERLEREAAFHQAIKDGALQLAWRLWRNAAGAVVAIQPRAVWPAAPAGAGDLRLLAEECGLSRELGDWLFRQAASSTDLTLPLPAGQSLAFAVSSPQILDPFVVQRLRAWINRHAINPAQVLLLIPWREDEAAVLRRRLPELAAEGVKLALYLSGQGSALDAFASGPWQAMVLGQDYLSRLPPDRAGAVVSALADLGGRLGWQVLAEGAPAGMETQALFLAGISACSEDLTVLSSVM
ncbi:MAG: diguanylate cyclase [bacterium]|nr:diguanylate cyclase [bacterium]